MKISMTLTIPDEWSEKQVDAYERKLANMASYLSADIQRMMDEDVANAIGESIEFDEFDKADDGKMEAK